MPKREKTRDPNIKKIGGEFYFRGYIEGKLIEQKLDADSFGLAKEKKEQLLLKARAVGLSGSRLSISHLETDYISHREKQLLEKRIRQRTFKEARDLLKLHLVPFFSRFKISDIEDHWPSYCRKVGGNNLPNHRKVLMHLLKWARRERYIKVLPELEVEQPKRRERANLTFEEIRQAWPHLSSNVRLHANMCLFMGMRPGEAWGLSWDRVNFERNCILLTSDDVKTRTAREVPLHPGVRAELEKRSGGRESDWVFTNLRNPKRRASYGSYNQVWQRALAKAKVERHLTPHDLRATFEHFAHSNPDYTETQLEKMLGARVDVQRKTYVKMKAEHLQKLVGAVEVPGLFSENSTKHMGNGWEKSKSSKDKRRPKQ